MWKTVRYVGLAIVTVAGVLAISGGTAMAWPSEGGQKPYTCSGGDFASGNLTPIPSGNYSSITVTGACTVPAGAVVRVSGNVRVTPGAALDAQSAPSTITVGRDVTAGKGSILGLGCQPPSYTGNSAHECMIEPEGHSTIVVKGSVSAFGADTVLLNGVTVKHNVTLLGGGGQIPWAIKNNTIGGNLTAGGVTASWFGVLFNNVGANTVLIGITVNDAEHPGGLAYVVRNTIGRNLICAGIDPGVSGGFVPGSVNVVGRHALGQCASLV